MVRRILAALLSLIVMAAFYVFAVMMEDEESKRTGEFLVAEERKPLTRMEDLKSADAVELARAFGAAIPLPEGLSDGLVQSGTYHGYPTRLVTLQGTLAQVRGIRPASAAPGLMPRDAVFLASGQALLGYPLLAAQGANGVMYSLLTEEAAFLIFPAAPPEPGGFTLIEP
jgi:hypothetical protein